MNDNVIILGAGSSFDAHVPLSAGFVNKIREFANKGSSDEGPLSDIDKEIFLNALKVLKSIEKYHSHAEFDDRNIEDILSILSFNIIGNPQTEKSSMEWMIKAIARTIELTCNVKHNGELNKPQGNMQSLYKTFWINLFNRFNDSKNIPTIVTFNYDLVLERALFQLLINSNAAETPIEFDGFVIRYYYKFLEKLSYKIVKTIYTVPTLNDPFGKRRGMKLERCDEKDLGKFKGIEILKLHGSLNFPKQLEGDTLEYRSPTNLVSEPFIIPPISDKSISADTEEIWRVALNNLKSAKNIVIVGYSLPRTDTYIQYFLKTALGSNTDLENITVFNPDLVSDTKTSKEMRERYGSCFSRQVNDRLINFTPHHEASTLTHEESFEHFVSEITNPQNGLFY